MRRAAALAIALVGACAEHGGPGRPAVPEPATPGDPVVFLSESLRPWGDGGGLLAVTEPASGRVAVYDSALVALVLLRRGQRDRAGRVLVGLEALQGEDGSLPFSFTLPEPANLRAFVRSGAVAWVGYAAAEYLDASRSAPAREVALRLAHRAAAYLLARQVARPGDLRDGLVLGGSGTPRYDVDGSGAVHVTLARGELSWASTEHNVDAYFFLRALGRVTASAAYADAAEKIARALPERAWRPDAEQLTRGVGERGIDPALTLDCASWGAVFLAAIGDRARAEVAFGAADAPRYTSRDLRSSARGHRPHAYGPVLEDPRLMRRFAGALPARTWDRLEAVWPEGSAGVALAAWRVGRPDRARRILDDLEPLRRPDGALPAFTAEIPFAFDTRSSLAGTAWFELVRFEMSRGSDRPTLWIR